MENHNDQVSAKVAARITGRSYTYVVRKCKAGEVPGAEKRGKYWEIPVVSLEALQKRPTVEQEQKDAVVRLRNKDMKYEAIARALGISKSYAQRIGKRHEEEEAEIKRLQREGEAGEWTAGFDETATITVKATGRIFVAKEPVKVQIGEGTVWEMEPGDTLKLSYTE